MRRYRITITIDSGNQVQANVVATNQSDALKRLKAQQVYRDFVSDSEIKEIHIKEIKFKAIDPDRFILQKSERPGYLVCTDKENKIVVTFKDGEFNDTREITPLEDFTPSQMNNLPEILREIGEWLSTQ